MAAQDLEQGLLIRQDCPDSDSPHNMDSSHLGSPVSASPPGSDSASMASPLTTQLTPTDPSTPSLPPPSAGRQSPSCNTAIAVPAHESLEAPLQYGQDVTQLSLTCPICLELLAEPVLASCCGHSYCQLCLEGCLKRRDSCPLCREPLLTGQNTYVPNRTLRELLKSGASAGKQDASINIGRASDESLSDTAPEGGRSSGNNVLYSPSWIGRLVDQIRQKLPPRVYPWRYNDIGQAGRQLARHELDDLESSSYRTPNGQSHVDLRWSSSLARAIGPSSSSPHRHSRLQSLSRCFSQTISVPVSATMSTFRRRRRQYMNYCRVHWSEIQCIVYVLLFVVIVFFLRVQEEEFARQAHR